MVRRLNMDVQARTRTGEPIAADFLPDGFKRVERRSIVTRTQSSASLSIRKAGVIGYPFRESSSAMRDRISDVAASYSPVGWTVMVFPLTVTIFPQ